jgi:hypothetical protein
VRCCAGTRSRRHRWSSSKMITFLLKASCFDPRPSHPYVLRLARIKPVIYLSITTIIRSWNKATNHWFLAMSAKRRIQHTDHDQARDRRRTLPALRRLLSLIGSNKLSRSNSGAASDSSLATAAERNYCKSTPEA